jgi:hypothetical protein
MHLQQEGMKKKKEKQTTVWIKAVECKKNHVASVTYGMKQKHKTAPGTGCYVTGVMPCDWIRVTPEYLVCNVHRGKHRVMTLLSVLCGGQH